MEASGGQIGFDEFMHMALYQPGLGYYVSGMRKFGEEGDFITAPEMGDLFGRCIARQCQQVLAITGGDILEFGAGNGTLAAQILRELARQDCLPKRYLILEVSPELRQRQQAYLNNEIPRIAHCVLWVDALPTHFDGVVVANEVLDAMPVIRFRVGEHGYEEMKVVCEGNCFVGRYTPLTRGSIIPNTAALRSLNLAPGYESEVNHYATAWIKTIADCMGKGIIFIIDYGFPRREFYHPDRSRGSLICHYRHRAHTNPFINIGLQDITAHIDFTTLAETAVDAGLRVVGYTQQAAFLMALGILDLVESPANDVKAHITQTTEIKKLTLPSEMGELFKVLALGRGIDESLQGFAMSDHRARL